MGILSALIAFLRRRKKTEALQASTNKSIEALESSDLSALEESVPVALEISGSSASSSESVGRIEKDSLELGLAAGYTGRSIRSIENSLERIEMNMITKDWFKAIQEDRSSPVVQTLESIRDILKDHEMTEQKRFEAIISSISRLRSVSEALPEPFKAEIEKEISVLERNIPLSPQMERISNIVKESKEISYEDLRQKLGISLSALRGTLANMAIRTDKIERFTRENKGWIRFKGD